MGDVGEFLFPFLYVSGGVINGGVSFMHAAVGANGAQVRGFTNDHLRYLADIAGQFSPYTKGKLSAVKDALVERFGNYFQDFDERSIMDRVRRFDKRINSSFSSASNSFFSSTSSSKKRKESPCDYCRSVNAACGTRKKCLKQIQTMQEGNANIASFFSQK